MPAVSGAQYGKPTCISFATLRDGGAHKSVGLFWLACVVSIAAVVIGLLAECGVSCDDRSVPGTVESTFADKINIQQCSIAK